MNDDMNKRINNDEDNNIDDDSLENFDASRLEEDDDRIEFSDNENNFFKKAANTLARSEAMVDERPLRTDKTSELEEREKEEDNF